MPSARTFRGPWSPMPQSPQAGVYTTVALGSLITLHPPQLGELFIPLSFIHSEFHLFAGPSGDHGRAR